MASLNRFDIRPWALSKTWMFLNLKMTDTLTKKQRSETMSKVRSRDTKPELILRCGLHRLGFRYRLNNNHLPGRPDLVFPKLHAIVLVHGCYWHRHRGCKDASMPKTNVDFWKGKFAENVKRDRQKKKELEKCGWRVIVVWECQLSMYTKETINGDVLQNINPGLFNCICVVLNNRFSPSDCICNPSA